MYLKVFLLKELLVYLKFIIFFIEIGVLKVNGIKYNEYSLYIVFGFIKVLLGE